MTAFPVAVIGLGSIGLRHARNFLSLGCSVVGFDPLAERRAALAEAGGRGVDDLSDALAAARLAVVASPSLHHRGHVEQAMAAGCRVLVEKPISHVVEGLPELLAESERRQLGIYPAFNLRFLEVIRAAHGHLAGGIIGRPLWSRFICSSFLPDWRQDSDYRLGYAADLAAGGVLFDLVHEFDLANYLLGPAKTTAAAATRTGVLELPTEDCAQVSLRHDNGALTALHLDYCSRPRRRSFEICGTGGFLLVDLHRQELKVSDPLGRITIEDRWTADPKECYLAEAAAALGAAKGDAPFPITGQEAIAVLQQVIDARRIAGVADLSTQA